MVETALAISTGIVGVILLRGPQGPQRMWGNLTALLSVRQESDDEMVHAGWFIKQANYLG